MAETSKANEQQPLNSGGGRSINYPYISLETALERAQSLWDAVGKGSIPISSAATTWDYDVKSSGVRSAVSAMKQFGLIQDAGSGENREISLTDRALDILHPHDPTDRERAIQEAALAPKIYTDILAKFPMGIPTQDHIISAYLLREKDFNRKTVDSFIKNFRANIAFAKITNSGNMPARKDEQANEVAQIPETAIPETGAVSMQGYQPTVKVSPTVPSSTVPFKQDIFSLDEGQVVLQWPETMSAASYEDFKAWVDLQVRKIGRAVKN